MDKFFEELAKIIEKYSGIVLTMIAHGLEVTNYCVPSEEGDQDE